MLNFAPDMKIQASSVLFIVAMIALLPDTLMGNPRAEAIQGTCGSQLQHNTTVFSSNFITNMENITEQVKIQGWGVSSIGSGPDTSYALAQCRDDLSRLECVSCYARLRTSVNHCNPPSGGQVFLDGCFLRVENYNFYEGLTPENYTFYKQYRGYWDHVCGIGTRNDSASSSNFLPLSARCLTRYSDTNFLNPEPQNGTSTVRQAKFPGNKLIVALVCSVVLVAGAGFIGGYMCKHKLQKKRNASKLVGANDKRFPTALRDGSLERKYSTLKKATDSFHDSNKLGQGGFGTVYKGILTDGRELAIKRLFFNNHLRGADFYNEVNIISSIRHKNLVRLLGCSCSGPEGLLVYELLPNGSLDRFIFDPIKGKVLNWEKRFNIIMGTAEGLVYLHESTESRIVHRDIKASNILLDSKLNAKIADFGLVRSIEGDKSHITTAIAGTLGYMAPEYIIHGQLTEKADVYSFGVLLLEIVSGRHNNRNKNLEYSDSLVTIMWKHFQLGRLQELFDTNVMLNGSHELSIEHEMLRVVHVGLLCTQKMPSLRPSMSTALQMLSRKDEHLPSPTPPPYADDDELTTGLGDIQNEPRYTPKSGNSASNASFPYSTFYPR